MKANYNTHTTSKKKRQLNLVSCVVDFLTNNTTEFEIRPLVNIYVIFQCINKSCFNLEKYILKPKVEIRLFYRTRLGCLGRSEYFLSSMASSTKLPGQLFPDKDSLSEAKMHPSQVGAELSNAPVTKRKYPPSPRNTLTASGLEDNRS